MQDEINEKVVALSVKGAKLTAETLQKAIKAMLAQAKKQQEKQPHGKQTLKQLAKQNAGLSNIEITEGNIKAFEQTAKKYGIDFALKKDSTETKRSYPSRIIHRLYRRTPMLPPLMWNVWKRYPYKN